MNRNANSQSAGQIIGKINEESAPLPDEIAGGGSTSGYNVTAAVVDRAGNLRVREVAAAQCQHRCDAADIVLYLSHPDDLRAVFAAQASDEG